MRFLFAPIIFTRRAPATRPSLHAKKIKSPALSRYLSFPRHHFPKIFTRPPAMSLSPYITYTPRTYRKKRSNALSAAGGAPPPSFFAFAFKYPLFSLVRRECMHARVRAGKPIPPPPPSLRAFTWRWWRRGLFTSCFPTIARAGHSNIAAGFSYYYPFARHRKSLFIHFPALSNIYPWLILFPLIFHFRSESFFLGG